MEDKTKLILWIILISSYFSIYGAFAFNEAGFTGILIVFITILIGAILGLCLEDYG